MPIYEFYCPRCNTVFSFFSPSVDTRANPDCPKCKRPGLERKPSAFALGHGGRDEGGDGELGDLDDANLERVLSSMDDELSRLGDRGDDPRALAQALRRLGDAAGLEPGPKLEGLLERLESGDDPDSIEGELDDALDGTADNLPDGLDDDGALSDLFRRRRRAAARRRPRVDDTLYFL